MRQMRMMLAVLLLSSLAATKTRADEITNNFQANLNQIALDALAEDVGALIGGGSFHQGRSLGFPLGFDVGVHIPVVEIQNDNVILKDDGSREHSLWGQAELGLPGKIDVIARVGTLLDGDLIGGGVRYGVFKPTLPGLPSVSVSALYNAMDHDFIEVKTYSANLVVSFDLPFIHPYVGGGYDRTTLEPTTQGFAGAPAAVSRNLDADVDGYRAEAGINISVLPFTYFSFGAGLANGNALYHAGAGIRF